MFREMRRKHQALSKEACEEILRCSTFGVLGVSGEDNYPYTVPLSYVYWDDKIYFHCARTGYKLDSIVRNNRVSFCVVGKDQIAPEEYTTRFRSVIAFGTARILSGEGEKREALRRLVEKYSPGRGGETEKKLEKPLDPVNLVEITIQHLSGKEAAELAQQRTNALNP